MRLPVKIFTAITLCAPFCASSQNASAPGIWPAQTATMKPWVRWWWLGNDVDTQSLGHRIDQMRDANIGGAEITPIYGVKGREATYIQFLSPQWMSMLRFCVHRAAKNGMAMDMNVGTGWPFGGPQITPGLAAGRLRTQTFSVDGSSKGPVKIPADTFGAKYPAPLVALTAYGSKGEVIDLLPKAGSDGTINWKPGKGSWELFAAYSAKTGQKVKRAAPGGEGLVLDHFQKEATETYLSRFDAAFGGKKTGIRSFFNDSYEVYNADFTPTFFTEFQRRRGYDLKLHLKQLLEKGDSDTTRRLRSDFRLTMSELVYENFSGPFSAWIRKEGGLSRNQAHGFPGNSLDLYAAVDVPEPEMFGIIPVKVPGIHYYTDPASFAHPAPDPVMVKFAASAAGAYGKPLVSCETFTWMGEHFKTPLSHCKPEVEQAFLAGVNHIFYHGMPYSPDSAKWPGWLFYASVHFGPSNSWWPHVKGLDDYIARSQSILQSSNHDAELMVYWPYDDVRELYGKGGLLQMVQINNINDWLKPSVFYKDVTQLLGRGYQLDYVSDRFLKDASVDLGKIRIGSSGNPHQVLIVPDVRYMNPESFKRMLDLARNGATIVLQSLPAEVPGFLDQERRRKELADLVHGLGLREADGIRMATLGNGRVFVDPGLEKALDIIGVQRETIADAGIQMLRKTRNGDKLYYLVNHTANDYDGWLPTQIAAQHVRVLDPQTGASGKAAIRKEDGKTLVRVRLPAGSALFLEAGAASDPEWAYTEATNAGTAVSGPWTLRFESGGPVLPKTAQLKTLQSWTELGDTAGKFSGTAIYETSFSMPAKQTGEFELDLGDVRESARVWINGKDAGIVWSIPAKVNIGKLLKPGKNTIRIQVANLMANRIIDMDRRQEQWRNFHEINFVNYNYKPFDAAGWEPMPSGLLGPVVIRPVHPVKSNQP